MKKNTNNKKVRALLVLGLSLILALTMSVSSFAASGFTSQDAVKKALKNANLTQSKVVALETDYDDGKYEVEFTKKSSRVEYSYEYSNTGKLIEKSVDYNRAHNYGAKKISKSKAISKVAKAGNFKKSTVSKGSCKLTKDDGQRIYEIHFSTKNYRYEYEVHARTGKILEYSMEARGW